MTKNDIFNIQMPNNIQLRTWMSLVRLANEFEKSKMFDLNSAKIAARFPINAEIQSKINKRESYIITWQRLCTKLFAYLIGPACFLDRKDKDDLVCLPIHCRLDNGLVYALNIYDNTNRIATIIQNDPDFENQFSFYTNKLVSYGSWVSSVRNDVQQFNLYGLNLDADINCNTSVEQSNSIESFQKENEMYGNTVTVYDIFNKIKSIKNTLCQRKL